MVTRLPLHERCPNPIVAACYLPPVPASTVVADLHPVTGGRFEATCGKCLRPSLRVAAVDAAHAWEELQRIGWTPYKSYVLCPACTKDPPNVDRDAAAARKKRKRR